ncbi:MAG: ATP-binding protein [Rhodospirillales bacterium]
MPNRRWRWIWGRCCARCWTRRATRGRRRRSGWCSRGVEHFTFHGRSLALKRAFTNLVSNAVKYGGSAHVRLAPPADGMINITVEDDGPGVPPGSAGAGVRSVLSHRGQP